MRDPFTILLRVTRELELAAPSRLHAKKSKSMLAVLLLSLSPITSTFLDEKGKPVSKSKESVEHALIRRHISKQSCGVLELGARYGTSSCAIAHHIDRKDAIVSVEADPSVSPATARNLRENNCSNHLISGVVATRPMVRSKRRNGSGYTNYFEVLHADGKQAAAAIANESSIAYTPTQLERTYGVRFDSMVVDCEGCFDAFVSSFPGFVSRIETIILEADYGMGMQRLGYANYTALEQSLHAMGFGTVERFDHPCCRKPPFNQISMMVFKQAMRNGPMTCA
jgi:hypothetical protein